MLKEGKSGQYQREGYGSQPYSNFEQIMFDCHNQDFKRWGFIIMYLHKAGSKGVSPDLPICSLLQCDGSNCQQQ